MPTAAAATKKIKLEAPSSSSAHPTRKTSSDGGGGGAAAESPTTTTTMTPSIKKKKQTRGSAAAATATAAAAAATTSPYFKKKEEESTSADADDLFNKFALSTAILKGGDLSKITSHETSPYPQLDRPSPLEALYARDLLADLHGEPDRDELEENCSGKGTLLEKRARSVLDSLVRTILSQNTTDKLSKVAFESLKERFPTYKQVLAAPPGKVEAAIKFAGLSEIKVARIRTILETVLKERPADCVGGEPSLEYVRAMSTEEIKAELGRFKGVGPKTIACVLLFTIGHDDFAVDTHVWHIAKKLGWVPGSASREATYAHLNNRIPDCVRYSLHVLLVLHGKKCPSCSKGGRIQLPPADGPCPLGQVSKMRTALSSISMEALKKASAAGAAAAAASASPAAAGAAAMVGKKKAAPLAVKKEMEEEEEPEPKRFRRSSKNAVPKVERKIVAVKKEEV